MAAPRAPAAGYVQVLDERPSGIACVVATGEPLLVPDAPRHPGVRPDLVERFNAASGLFVPVAWDGEVRHVAILLCHEPRDFDADAIELAETLADQAAAGLARLEAERAAPPQLRAATTRSCAPPAR